MTGGLTTQAVDVDVVGDSRPRPAIQRSVACCLDSLGPSPFGAPRHGSRRLEFALQLGNAGHSWPQGKFGNRGVPSVFPGPQRLPRSRSRLMGAAPAEAGYRRPKTAPFPIIQRGDTAFHGIEDLTDGIVRHLPGGFRRKFRGRGAKGFAQSNETRRIGHAPA